MEFDVVQKRKRFLINLLYLIAVIGITIFCTRYVVGLFIPFVVALVIASILRPVARLIDKKTKLSYKTASIFAMVLFYVLLILLFTVLGSKMIGVVESVVIILPDIWRDTLQPLLEKMNANLSAVFASQGIGLNDMLSKALNTFGSKLVEVSSRFLGATGSVAVSVPNFLISMIVCIVSSFYFLTDWTKIKAFCIRQMPEHAREVVPKILEQLGKTLLQYIRSYGTIMLITFVELLIGFCVIRVEHTVLFAVVIAVFDILPVVGCGTVLVPWVVIELFAGNINRGIALLILYIIITAIRNIIEPKVVGTHVGLHPLATLMGMIIGVKIWGPIGLFGLPITLAVIKQLNDDGVICIMK